jgi:hypothetical protein
MSNLCEKKGKNTSVDYWLKNISKKMSHQIGESNGNDENIDAVTPPSVLLVRAKYAFDGRNNDEVFLVYFLFVQTDDLCSVKLSKKRHNNSDAADRRWLVGRHIER